MNHMSWIIYEAKDLTQANLGDTNPVRDDFPRRACNGLVWSTTL